MLFPTSTSTSNLGIAVASNFFMRTSNFSLGVIIVVLVLVMLIDEHEPRLFLCFGDFGGVIRREAYGG